MEGKIPAIVVLSSFADAALAIELSDAPARVDLDPGGSLVVGFVAPQDGSAAILLRGVGPSLKAFKAPDPAVSLALCDSEWSMPFVPGAGSVAPMDWTGFLPSMGAFPPAGGDRASACFFTTVSRGSYTVVVGDTANLGGTVPFEIHELPFWFGGLAPVVSLPPS